MGGNNEFFENFERNKYLKKLPSMQRVNILLLQGHMLSNLCEGHTYRQGLVVPNNAGFQKALVLTAHHL